MVALLRRYVGSYLAGVARQFAAINKTTACVPKGRSASPRLASLFISLVLTGLSLSAATPTITSFTPTSGGAGTSVVISGTNLTGATAVKFNGIAASSFSGTTTITAVAPAGVTTGKISVTTAGGTATSSASFTVAAPTITSFTPTSGTVGTLVTLTGTNFTGATAVKFNGTAATSYSVASATSITAVAPTGVTTGKLTVTTSGGTATSSASFTVAAPTITSFTPTSGVVGTTVTLTGTNFLGATAVKFNGIVATSYTVVSGTSITATVPTGATTGKLTVTTSGGTATSSSNFTIVAAPTITSFTPTNGMVGTSVTLTGTNFLGATSVKFNGAAATSYTVAGATSISAVAPTGVTTGAISVTTPGGTATSSLSFVAFDPADLGKVILSPASANMVAGGTISISASVLGSTQGVTWRVDAGSWSYNTTICNYTAAYQGTPLPADTYTLTATSIEYPDKSATLDIHVFPVGTTVGITPATAGCGLGGQVAFSAVVLGEANQAVTWVASDGSITPDGVFTAPLIEKDVTVTATSVANSTKKGTVTVTVIDPANLGKVIITPALYSMAAGNTVTFTAISMGSTQGVTWEASAGSWYYNNTQCDYTAGYEGEPLEPGTYTLVATSIEYPNQSTQVTIQVYPVGTTVVITPNGAGLLPGAQIAFSALVLEESNQAVTWSLVGGGTISAQGIYTAPPIESFALVKATSNANPAKSAIVRVGVSLLEHMGLVTVIPSEAILRSGEVQTFNATVQGSGQGVNWSLEGGSVTATPFQAIYTAGSMPGIYLGYASSEIANAPSAVLKIQIYPAAAPFGIVPQG